MLSFLVKIGVCGNGLKTDIMAITTIKVTDLVSPSYIDLIPNQIYNLLVNENGKTVDIRCRVISKSKNRILIFKLQG
jgi:hypothetical protein